MFTALLTLITAAVCIPATAFVTSWIMSAPKKES